MLCVASCCAKGSSSNHAGANATPTPLCAAHARPAPVAAYVADYSGNAGGPSSAPKPAAPAALTNGAIAMAGGAVAAAGNVNIKVVDTSPGAQAQA
jgi:hypothetical protein